MADKMWDSNEAKLIEKFTAAVLAGISSGVSGGSMVKDSEYDLRVDTMASFALDLAEATAIKFLDKSNEVFK